MAGFRGAHGLSDERVNANGRETALFPFMTR
jgi:hypothetical protein